MRRLAQLSALLIAFVLVGAAAFCGEKTWQPIKVSWHGQSFFIVESSKGFRVAVDPHLIPEYGRPSGLKADFILFSHNHNDHNRIEALENHKDKTVRIIPGLKGAGLRADWNLLDEAIGNLRVRTVGTYHDDMEGLRAGKNSVFVVEMDGWRIAHLGDLGHQLTAAQAKQIGDIDVLMIPVGGVFTINGSEAKKVVAQLKPREYVFPMHYATKVYDDLLPANEYLDGQEKANVAESDDNVVTLNRDPQRPKPLIVLLNFAGKKK
jgi:L-ascorbate metabolism protein UlaG (beta-lactamase superfamily)